MSKREVEQATKLSSGSRARRDRRPAVLALLLLLLVPLAVLVDALPKRGVETDLMGASTQRPADPFRSLQAPAGSPEAVAGNGAAAARRDPEQAAGAGDPVHEKLALAENLIRERKYDQSIRVLDANREMLKDEPVSYLLLGMALEGRREYAAARDFYLAAVDRDPYIADAYWGVATTSEHLGELDSAIGAMRNYLHTEPDPDPQRLRINQARSAIWEWEALLGRGPWGPTQGVPPGFSPEELRRDGRGVAVKMPLEDTLRADGTWQYEIKHADKIKIYPRP